MRVLGTFASAPMRCRQRPPVPIRPMLMRSFAPTGCAEAGSANADVAATVAAEVVKNERRERDVLAMRFPRDTHPKLGGRAAGPAMTNDDTREANDEARMTKE